MDQSYNYGLTPDQLSASPAAASMAPAPAPTAGFSSLLPSSNAKYVEKDGKHKGGAGVARDILGFLGDFLLTRLHMKPMYSEAQTRRKEQAALEGFGADPQSTADALSRLGSIDPARRDKLQDQFIDNRRLDINAQSIQEARAARVADLKEKADARTRNYAASMVGTMAGWDEDKRKQYYPQLRSQIIAAGNRQGLDLSTELPESYDGVALDAWADGAVPLGTQRSQRLTKDRIENQDRQAGERIRVTERGQNINDQNQDENRSSREKIAGQADSTRRRGQDITSKDRRYGIDKRPPPAPKKLQPSEADIEYLKAHPEKTSAFDGKFGLGSSKKVLGN